MCIQLFYYICENYFLHFPNAYCTAAGERHKDSIHLSITVDVFTCSEKRSLEARNSRKLVNFVIFLLFRASRLCFPVNVNVSSITSSMKDLESLYLKVCPHQALAWTSN